MQNQSLNERVKDIVISFQKGMLTKNEMYNYLERIIAYEGVNKVISHLPEDYYEEYVKDLRRRFEDYSIADDDFFLIHDPERLAPQIAREVRKWLENKK